MCIMPKLQNPEIYSNEAVDNYDKCAILNGRTTKTRREPRVQMTIIEWVVPY